MSRKITLEIITGLLVLLFVYAAVSKLSIYGTFKMQLLKSPYTTSFASDIAWSLPAVELGAATLLIIKRTRLLGLYLSFFLMLLFTGYIYAILHFSSYVPCSCGGILSKMNWGTHFLLNIFFTMLAVIGIVLDKPEETSLQTKMKFQ